MPACARSKTVVIDERALRVNAKQSRWLKGHGAVKTRIIRIVVLMAAGASLLAPVITASRRMHLPSRSANKPNANQRFNGEPDGAGSMLAVRYAPLTPQPMGQTFVVTNTNDSGLGSLRQAITDSNASFPPDVNTISFNIPGAGIQTIAPLSPLLNITHPVIIDGYTQPGASANTLAVGDNANLLIELNGASASSVDCCVVGLHITAGSSTVKGLVVNRFIGGGIEIEGSGNTVVGNFIGTDFTGSSALATQVVGVDVPQTAPNSGN